jgi:hypothetical protein
MNQVKVSVVTICLNHARGLERTLKSIDMQNWDPIHCFVIDGGSTDGSLEILQRRAHLQNFTYLSEPDGGIFDAMNKGWKLADGDLIIMMNAGDCFASTTVVETIGRSYALESWRWGYGQAQILSVSESSPKILSFQPFRVSKLALGISTIPHQATVMQRTLLEELGGYQTDVGLAADQKLLLDAALISTPRLWDEVFANFEGGGISSHGLVATHILDMARYRRQSDIKVGGGAVQDSLLTFCLFTLKSVIAVLKLIKLVLSSHGQDIRQIFGRH